RLRSSSAPTPPGRPARASAPARRDTSRRVPAAPRACSFLGRPLRLLELHLDLLRDLGQLGQDLDRLVRVLRLLEPPARPLEPVEELLRGPQTVLRRLAHAASFTMRPSIPFTSLPASSDE